MRCDAGGGFSLGGWFWNGVLCRVMAGSAGVACWRVVFFSVLSRER